jgi:hypothetical protein
MQGSYSTIGEDIQLSCKISELSAREQVNIFLDLSARFGIRDAFLLDVKYDSAVELIDLKLKEYLKKEDEN